jgi:hypothetical protein
VKGEEAKLSTDWGRIASSFAFDETQDGILLSLLGEGRIALYNYRQGNQCLIALGMVAFLSQSAVFCSSAPEMFALGQVLWLSWVMMPLLSAPPSLRPRKRLEMLWERMPWKQSALTVMADPTKRYAAYAFIRLLPVAAFVTGMFFWTLVSLDPNAASMLNWQAVNGTDFDPTAVQGAQSFALLAFVWSGCFVSASFASRTDVEKDLEFKFWAIWLVCAGLAIGLQLAYNCVLSAVVVGSCTKGAFPQFGSTSAAVEHWLILILCPPVFVPLFAFPVKRHDRKYYVRAMQMMRLEFETKLGQFSPK